MRPRLLDLFCCAGGASRGYDLAGFDVVGVDWKPQPHYLYPLIVANALDILKDRAFLAEFDAIHCSPECKGYTNCNLSPKHRYQKLIGEAREALDTTGKPYIIENVMGAKRALHASLLLCGTMFGLPMRRHRLFETNVGQFGVFIHPPRTCAHKTATIGVYGHSIWDSALPGTPRKDGRKRPDSVPAEIGRRAMGIDWMTKEELAEALPPVYTEWTGHFLLEAIQIERAALVASDGYRKEVAG